MRIGGMIVFLLTALIPVTVVYSAGILQMLWPLDNNTYTTEVLYSSTQPVQKNHCALIFSEKPSSYPYPGVILDGSTPVDVRVDYPPVNSVGEDYAFSGMFRTSSTFGTLFHYKADDNILQNFKELLIWMSAGVIYIKRITTITEVSSSSVTLPSSWFHLSFAIDISNGNVKCHLDEVQIMNYNSFTANVDIIVPGTLRIGSTHDSSLPGLIGHVICAAYHTGIHKPPAADAANACQAPTWPSNVPDCTLTAVQRTLEWNCFRKPAGGIVLKTLNLISTHQRRTEVQCAMVCLTNNMCWYYKVVDLGHSKVDCLLYDSTVAFWYDSGTADGLVYQWDQCPT